MLGAIAGDIIGSIYEGRRNRIKHTDFPLFNPRSSFTDDTVLTVATAEALLHGLDYAAVYRAYVTHNHPEGIKGAQATALAVYLARTRRDKTVIKQEIEQRFGYNLSRRLTDIRPGYRFGEAFSESIQSPYLSQLRGVRG